MTETLPYCADSVKAIERHGISHLLKEMAVENDPYNVRARQRLYWTVIVPSIPLYTQYVAEYKEIHKYEDDRVDGLSELTALIGRIGWIQFIKALEWFAMRRLKIYIDKGKLVRGANQKSDLLTKIKALPKWLK